MNPTPSMREPNRPTPRFGASCETPQRNRAFSECEPLTTDRGRGDYRGSDAPYAANISEIQDNGSTLTTQYGVSGGRRYRSPEFPKGSDSHSAARAATGTIRVARRAGAMDATTISTTAAPATTARSTSGMAGTTKPGEP